jgi:hypothetical protein
MQLCEGSLQRWYGGAASQLSAGEDRTERAYGFLADAAVKERY